MGEDVSLASCVGLSISGQDKKKELSRVGCLGEACSEVGIEEGEDVLLEVAISSTRTAR